MRDTNFVVSIIVLSLGFTGWASAQLGIIGLVGQRLAQLAQVRGGLCNRLERIERQSWRADQLAGLSLSPIDYQVSRN